VERARGGAGAGRGTSVDAIRQTHQCRIPQRSFDSADQHHDTGAGPGDLVIYAALAGSNIIFHRSECAFAVTAPDFDDSPGSCHAGGGQKTGWAQNRPHRRASSASTRGAGSRSGGSGTHALGGE
jgi:hypothetical protein